MTTRWRANRLNGFLAVLPSLLLVGIFVYGFIGRTILSSLTDWGRDPSQALALAPVTRFVGLDNYRQLFTGIIDGRFRQDLVSTFFFTAFFLAGCLGAGLLLAVLRAVFLFPFALSFVVTGTIWRWLLQPSGGVNLLPTLFGLPAGRFAWLTSRQQVWRFDWNDLPVGLAVLLGLALACLAVIRLRARRTRRGVTAAALAVAALAW